MNENNIENETKTETPEQEQSSTHKLNVKPVPVNDNEAQLQEVLSEVYEYLSESKNLNKSIVDLRETIQKDDDLFKSKYMENFNIFLKRTDDLVTKLDREYQYTEYLQEQIRAAENETKAKQYELELAHEKELLEKFKNNLELNLKSFIESANQKIQELVSVDETVNKNINEFKENVGDFTIESSKNFKVLLNKSFDDYIKECTKTVDKVKDLSLNFLKQCKEEHIIIENILPNSKSVKIKERIYLSIIFIMSFFSILGTILNIFKG